MAVAPLDERRRRVLEAYAAGRAPAEIAASIAGSSEKALLGVLDEMCGQDPRRARIVLEEDALTRGLSWLFGRAAASTSARIRAAGDRARQQIAALRGLLDEDARFAEARARVAHLEAELAEARKALQGAGSSTAKPRGESDAKKVRDWARKKGIAVPAKGRVPAAVFQAYEQEATS